MSSPRKSTANRLNAARSTGPRTPAGKTQSSRNALAHGFRCQSPVLPGEDPAEWECFRAGVVADLAPVGFAEVEQANWIASLMWRRRRMTLFEVAAAVCPPPADPSQSPRLGWADPHLLKVGRERLREFEAALADARRGDALVSRLALAEDDERLNPDDALFLLGKGEYVIDQAGELVVVTFEEIRDRPPGPDERDIRFLAVHQAAGVPVEWHDDPAGWDGWTAGGVRAGLELLAGGAGGSVNQLLREMTVADYAWLEGRVAEARAAVEPREVAARGPTAIPPDAALSVILRYEPHLSRQLTQAMDQFERMRALRLGR